MEWEFSTIWYWIILAITGIVSAILGYFFGKSDVPSVSSKSNELHSLEIENAKLKTDLDLCRKRLDNYTLKTKQVDTVGNLGASKKEQSLFDPKKAKAAF